VRWGIRGEESFTASRNRVEISGVQPEADSKAGSRTRKTSEFLISRRCLIISNCAPSREGKAAEADDFNSECSILAPYFLVAGSSATGLTRVFLPISVACYRPKSNSLSISTPKASDLLGNSFAAQVRLCRFI
jgi:hypothetical protein